MGITEQMMKIAENDVVAYAIQKAELEEERKQLFYELKSKGECIVSNKEMQELNSLIEDCEASIEMAMQYIRNASKEEQPI